ncbi:MAG: phosphate ABC transporter ATP-binding protein [Chloroflexi bacterium]|nr:phosphate ABC transporter ATP-binding protein [Chloroflexota bacterium]
MTFDETPVLETRGLSVMYDSKPALRDVSFQVPRNEVIAIIGPSGSGKSTLLRCFNRMNDLIQNVSITGEVFFEEEPLYAPEVDPTEIRFRIGMVFQRPNPFPKSVYDNVAFGPRINGIGGDLDQLVEDSLRRAALWDEVYDRLDDSALQLSGGQQQRLCIARALAVDPEVILMDEPAASLDPISTQAIEVLIRELTRNVTIVIVTHNMQQAQRVANYAAVLMTDESRVGELIEYGPTEQIFGTPKDRRTEAYVTGRIG